MSPLRRTQTRATVDIVIAVHDTRRNIRRAVASVLADPDDSIRVIVVCHNLPATRVAALIDDLTSAHPTRLRFDECNDGLSSPSGPFNHGIDISDAEYVGIMGSDDELDQDAVATWRRTAIRQDADAVIAKVVRGSMRTLVRSPPRRLGRSAPLDFVKDRLSYRSAPLGLIRRDYIQRTNLRLLEGARNGGDLPFVTRLWLRGKVVHSRGIAAYIEHADAPVRVTAVAKPVREELEPIALLLASSICAGMTTREKDALVTKLVRRNVMDALRKRADGVALTPDDIVFLRELIEELGALAPAAKHMVSRAQRAVLDSLTDPDTGTQAIALAFSRTLVLRSLDSVLPARLRYVLHDQAQPRYVTASALIKIGASRYFPVARAAAWSMFTALAVLVLGRTFISRA